MKLDDFNNEEYSKRALKENYNLPFDVERMSIATTKNMLKKVRNLAMEAKNSSDFYANQTNPTYMKLVFMEQALVTHHNNLARNPRLTPRIVVENEEVEKSQVVLAAQDMVDSVQKMLEDVSDMQVKELPALVDSIQSEIGVNESEQFNTQVTQSLTQLIATLTQAKSALQGALNTITGQGDGFDVSGGDDLGMPPENGEGFPPEGSGEEALPAPEEVPSEYPEEEPVGDVGRAKR